jgi:hypothetical protein
VGCGISGEDDHDRLLHREYKTPLPRPVSHFVEVLLKQPSCFFFLFSSDVNFNVIGVEKSLNLVVSFRKVNEYYVEEKGGLRWSLAVHLRTVS